MMRSRRGLVLTRHGAPVSSRRQAILAFPEQVADGMKSDLTRSAARTLAHGAAVFAQVPCVDGT